MHSSRNNTNSVSSCSTLCLRRLIRVRTPSYVLNVNLVLLNIIFYIRPLSSVHNKCGSFCMNRTTFRDLRVSGVLVKIFIIALCRTTFLKENTNSSRYQIQFCIWPN